MCPALPYPTPPLPPPLPHSETMQSSHPLSVEGHLCGVRHCILDVKDAGGASLRARARQAAGSPVHERQDGSAAEQTQPQGADEGVQGQAVGVVPGEVPPGAGQALLHLRNLNSVGRVREHARDVCGDLTPGKGLWYGQALASNHLEAAAEG